MARDAGTEARRVAGALTSMRIDQLIANLAVGIARGQMKLDYACMQIAKFMGEAQIAFGKKAGRDVPDELSLIELGFAPNFYQFVDTILEISVAISCQYEEEYEYERGNTQGYTTSREEHNRYSNSESSYSRDRDDGFLGFGNKSLDIDRSSSYGSGSSTEKNKSLSVTTVDARYASTYNYSVEGASTIKTKIVPIPPPTVFEERVRALFKQQKERDEWLRTLYETKVIIPEVIAQAQKVGGDAVFASENLGITGHDLLKLGTITGTNRDDITHESSESLKYAIQKLVEEFDRLVTDHWAHASIADREEADNFLNHISKGVEDLLKNAFVYSEDTNVPPTLKDANDMPNDTLNGYLSGIKEKLKGFRNKMQGILTSLPETPEEKKEREKKEAEGGTP